MVGILIFIHTLVSIFLICVVLMQASQGGGLSGTMGGQAASNVLGGQSAGNVLSKITAWLAGIFLTLAVLISILSVPSNNQESSSIIKKNADEAPLSQESVPLIQESEATLDLDEK